MSGRGEAPTGLEQDVFFVLGQHHICTTCTVHYARMSETQKLTDKKKNFDCVETPKIQLSTAKNVCFAASDLSPMNNGRPFRSARRYSDTTMNIVRDTVASLFAKTNEILAKYLTQ